MTKVWIAVSALVALATWGLLAGQPDGPIRPGAGAISAARAAVFGLAVLAALGVGFARRRARPRAGEARPVWHEVTAFLVLVVGVTLFRPGRSAGFWWAWVPAVVLGPPILGWLAERVARRFPESAGRLAVLLILALLAGHFLLMFPADTWRHAVLADDYGIVHYNTMCDLDAIAAGGLYGWDHRVEGGRSLFLNLRTLAPLVGPLLPIGREAALHLLYLIAWLAFPLLVGIALAAALRPRTRPAARSALGWGVAAGGLLLLTFSANLYRFGMIYSMVAVDLLLLQIACLERLFRGGRVAGIGLGLAVGLGVYVHLAQQSMGLAFLAILYASRARSERRLGPWKLLAGAAAVALGLSLPFWAQLWVHRDFLAVHYLMGASPVLLAFEQAGPFGTAGLLIRSALWEFPGYFRLLVIGLPLLGLAAAGTRARLGGHVGVLGLVGLAAFLVWLPSVGYAMLRLHLLIAPLLAIVAGAALRDSRGYGRGALLTGLLVAVFGLPGLELWPPPHYSAPSLQVVEPALVATVRDLPGHRVLFENSAGQSPLKDLTRPYDVFPGTEVQRAGPLALAASRDLFAHAGWDPYPYHRLRDAFLVNGAWQGDALAEIDDAAFEATLRRYAVGSIVVWSPGARQYFAVRTDRYAFVTEIPPCVRRQPVFGRPLWTRAARLVGGAMRGPLDGTVRVPAYAVYRIRGAPGLAVHVEQGEGRLTGRSPFSYVVSVRGAKRGAAVTLATRYLPGWTASCDPGTSLEVTEVDGRLAVRAPRDGELTLRFQYDRRRRDLVAGFGVFILGLAVCVTGRRKKPKPGGEPER